MFEKKTLKHLILYKPIELMLPCPVIAILSTFSAYAYIKYVDMDGFME